MMNRIFERKRCGSDADNALDTLIRINLGINRGAGTDRVRISQSNREAFAFTGSKLQETCISHHTGAECERRGNVVGAARLLLFEAADFFSQTKLLFAEFGEFGLNFGGFFNRGQLS